MADLRTDSGSVGGYRLALVCGVGVAGAAATRALLSRGVEVLLTAATEGAAVTELSGQGAQWRGPLAEVPSGVDVVIASPGIRPTDALLVDAAAKGIPVWGEIELAWQLRAADAAPWLALTGTNGKTTTVHMLESILRSAGLRALAVGNVGVSIIDAVVAKDPYDVLAVELSSQQLHFAPSIRPLAGALLNIAPDHLDWHGSMEAYVEAKAAVWYAQIVVGNVDDPKVAGLFAGAGARTRVSVTVAEPRPGGLGVHDGALVSNAFGDDHLELLPVSEVRPAGAHNVSNALVAAALARAFGITGDSIATGLRRFEPDPHRNAFVAERAGVAYIDDSKATNGHAARASLLSYPRVVWIAGGQLKGATVDDLVIEIRDRLAGVVLLGVDRAVVAEALRRHAPDVPLIEVSTDDDGAMHAVVNAAAGLARPGDTVLLAPAAASYDMFANYSARGDAFAAAVLDLR